MRFKHQTFLDVAEIIAKNSYAERLKVGAVLADEDRILAIGYNGTPKGFDNTCEFLDENKDLKTKDIVVHAEQNLICFCAKKGIKTNNCSLYITHSPCITCAKMIISAGIKEVFYGEIYRDLEGIKFLEKFGIKILKI